MAYSGGRAGRRNFHNFNRNGTGEKNKDGAKMERRGVGGYSLTIITTQ